MGPDFRSPESNLGDQWAQPPAAGITTDHSVEARWWQQFNDPVLDTLIDRALSDNLSLRAAGLNVLAARAQLGIAVGSRYPQVQRITANATALSASESGANTAGPADLQYQQYGLGFEAGWELDFWGRFQRGIEASDAALQASIAGYDHATVLLIAQVAANYTSFRSLQAQLQISKDNLALQNRSYQIADVLFRNGENSELDMQQALTLLRSTQATIPALESDLRRQINALGVLLATTPAEIIALLASPADIPSASETIAVGLPADMLRRRPDVREAELQARAQSARIGIAEADLYPSISLVGSIGLVAVDGTPASGVRSGNTGIGAMFNSDSISYGMGPSLNWNFLNYGRLKNNVRVQDARLQQALELYRQTVLRAGQEVEDALAVHVGARAQRDILADVVVAAKRSSDLALLQYQEGLASYQRVLDSQQALFAQQQRHLQARTLTTASLISLYKSLGGGWEIRLDRPMLDDATLQQMRERTDWGELLSPTALEPPADDKHTPDW